MIPLSRRQTTRTVDGAFQNWYAHGVDINHEGRLVMLLRQAIVFGGIAFVVVRFVGDFSLWTSVVAAVAAAVVFLTWEPDPPVDHPPERFGHSDRDRHYVRDQGHVTLTRTRVDTLDVYVDPQVLAANEPMNKALAESLRRQLEAGRNEP